MRLYPVALVRVDPGADEVEAGGARHELAVAAAHHARAALRAHGRRERGQPRVARRDALPAVACRYGRGSRLFPRTHFPERAWYKNVHDIFFCYLWVKISK